ncbi:MAG: 3-hydroxyacyl-CoA dehydrogenase family protein [Planctomycetaceae bacterium]|jgi:3-hydroxyacyl-CoA dehydrogenase/enoyl-CoA hydratase/3-hydroxybutyryl-CoA epimerase/enoyl-CoA isomerase|nr:3-hydroxyacyl-CoA dehydrogenase family protein [Planctomycetaceae bacterium]
MVIEQVYPNNVSLMNNCENKTVAILGAGQMGIAIAAIFLRQRFSVVLYDTSSTAVESARDRTAAELKMQIETNLDAALRLLECTDNLQPICSALYVLESVTEKKRVKEKLYRQIMPLLKNNAILMSNTSTISITELAETLENTLIERFCGFHFFHPVRSRSLVEIVRGNKTSASTIQNVESLARAIDKTSIAVNDGAGFLVNRLLNAYLSGALQLLTEGGTIRQIDTAAERFGMAMGPFRIMDEIGLDVTLHGGWVLYKAFPDRVEPSPILLELTRLGFLGRKTGRGFYCYKSAAKHSEVLQLSTKTPSLSTAEVMTMWDTPVTDNAELNAMIAKQFINKNNESAESFTNEKILARTVGEMFHEAQRILDDGVTHSLRDLKLAAVLGLGFPQHRWNNDCRLV